MPNPAVEPQPPETQGSCCGPDCCSDGEKPQGLSAPPQVSPETIKAAVRETYGEIARKGGETSCCGMETPGPEKSSCCGGDAKAGFSYTFVEGDYKKLPGYLAEADLGLGCGIPTQFADLKPGETVLDLGAGAGNDAFVARSFVGETGRVLGVDMTAEMVTKARENNRKAGFTNVEFRLGEIEHLPVDRDAVDVVVSNCVLNLVPDKRAAFSEMARVLKAGGRFCVSDIVTRGEIPPGARKAAALYAGCVSGAIPKGDYLGLIAEQGFHHIEVRKERVVEVPREVLEKHLSSPELEKWTREGSPVVSVTVTGKKP